MELNDLRELDLNTPAEIVKYITSDWQPTPRTDYVAWLQEVEDEIVYRVWAYKTTKKKGQQHREVIRSLVGKPQLIYRDMYLTQMGGYKVVFEP